MRCDKETRSEVSSDFDRESREPTELIVPWLLFQIWQREPTSCQKDYEDIKSRKTVVERKEQLDRIKFEGQI